MAHTATLYGTSGCHLCDDALTIVKPITERLNIVIQEVDIAGDDVHEVKYGIRIPVLSYNSRELAWPFSAEQVWEFLTTLKD